MTTAQALIEAAFREGNLIAADAPISTTLMTEALGRLNNFLFSLMGNELGEALQEWPVPPPQFTAPVMARYPLINPLPLATESLEVWPYPPNNARLMVSATQATTVYLQAQPNDGARVAYIALGSPANLTLNGNGRLIEGQTSIELESALVSGERTWLYRGDLGNWIRLGELTLTTESPLPAIFDDLLITGLCIRLSSRFGNDPRQGTVMTYKDQLAKLQARYRQPTAALGGSSQVPPTYQAYATFPGGALL